ncbi:MAG: RdgB/HAM1 family non-canonical purine NTP pyrophosphatase [Candidatus Cloacimonetes bacterium]|jgi:XTP/dITP diphosphohydrolase|nr:RdgB/HAM1 family non-canonical purine NTP pyrophosphatase [Candidatus Cloacimonadota bacterium]
MKLLLATRNEDKVIEIKEILKDLDVEIISASQFPDMPDVIEDKDTIKGNSIKKATDCAKFSNLLTIADDTGLFVEALDGKPGVHAARFAGEGCSYKDNRVKLLKEMKNVSNRNAQFRTVCALVSPDGLIATTEGTVEGKITEEEYGDNGFGYDAIFKADETGKTFGEMSQSEKEKISHRSRALKKMIPIIKKVTQTSVCDSQRQSFELRRSKL